jgi:hypothetical protein
LGPYWRHLKKKRWKKTRTSLKNFWYWIVREWNWQYGKWATKWLILSYLEATLPCHIVILHDAYAAVQSAYFKPQWVAEIAIKYLNRLSDYLFVLARKLSQDLSAEEVKWIPRK